MRYNVSVMREMDRFPRYVAGPEGFEFRLDRPFKNKTGTYTVMVQMPNGGRFPVRNRNRDQAVEDAVRRGNEMVAWKIAQGYLGS
jgi:hypothetical protein